MKVCQNITIDLAKNEGVAYADAVQGDSARFLRLILEENGAAWNVPKGVVVVVRYGKPDGTGGTYDTLPDGKPAGVIQGNVLELGLAPQVCSVAGKVHLQIVFMKHDSQVSSFAMVVNVEESVNFEKESQEYVNLSAWLQQNKGKDGKDGEPGKNGKDGEPGKEGYTPIKGVDYYTNAERKAFVEDIKSDMKDDFALSIVNDAAGESISLVDSAEFGIRGLVLYGKTIQDGTPDPENPVDIGCAGSNGRITVTVDETQILTALTPSGLYEHDYIDFAKGVRVQGSAELVLDGTENYRLAANSAFNNTQIQLHINAGQKRNTNASSLRGVWCNYFKEITPNESYMGTYNGFAVDHTNEVFHFNHAGLIGTTITSAADWASYVKGLYDAGNPIIIRYPLVTPIETPLTEAELAQYAKLHTNYPTTIITNNESVGMKVSYVADTKNYIDNKLNS